MAKHMLMLSDASLYEILGFLDGAELAGKDIATVVPDTVSGVTDARHNIAYEARALKRLFLKLKE